MKNTKRVLLSLLAAIMLLGCFGAMAGADNSSDYITYTVKGGDTALGICAGLKIDFFANQAWISEVNNIGSYNNIKVNQVLYLPTFDTSKDPTRANKAKEEIKKAAAAAQTTAAASAAPAAVGTTSIGDSVVSYLINYKLQPGETVGSVCAKLGVDFDANADKIKKLSGFANYYHVPAGQIVVIPSLKVPEGSSYTQIVAHQVKGGETAATICGLYKLDFAKVQGQLKALNNTENLNRISVGQTFYLPVPVGTAGGTVSAPSGTAATTANTTNNTAAGAAATGSVVTAGDTIVSYLINYKLQAGETVGSVCAKLGVDFDANADKIKKLSGFSNYYHVPAGQMIVIPSMSVPQGYSYTAIVAHQVRGGETAATICGQYKLDFAKVEGQLKTLNNTDNLSRISVGQTFYLPVPGGTAGAGSTAGGTTAAANNAVSGSAAAPAAVTGQTYKITGQSSAHGAFVTQVGGQNVAAAPAGSDVKIVAEPETGYKVYSITVTKTGTNQAFPVGPSNFTMPNCDVTVTVTFKTAQ